MNTKAIINLNKLLPIIFLALTSLTVMFLVSKQPTKVRAAPDGTANYIVHHVDEEGNRFDIDTKPPISLNGKTEITEIIAEPTQGGWTLKNVRGENCTVTWDDKGKKIIIKLTDQNSYTNPGIVKCIYEKDTFGVTINANWFTINEKEEEASKYQLGGQTYHPTMGEDFTLPTPTAPDPFKLFKINKRYPDNGTAWSPDHLTVPKSFKVTRNVDYEFWFKPDKKITNYTVVIHTMAVELDDDFNMVHGPNGERESARGKEVLNNKNDGDKFTAYSPWSKFAPPGVKATKPDDMEFLGIARYADFESGAMEPSMPGVLKAPPAVSGTGEEFNNLTASSSKLTYYVYFYYKKKGDTKVKVNTHAIGLNEDNSVDKVLASDSKERSVNKGKGFSVTTPASNLDGWKFDNMSWWNKADTTYSSSIPGFSGGQKFTTETVTITEDGRKEYNVYFYYKKGEDGSPGGGGGEIVFTPHQTTWTNKGKTGNGTGVYPVDVKYVGTNPIIKQANYTWKEIVTGTDADGKPTSTTITHSGTFPVTYSLNRIEVSGSESKTISGSQGTVNIDQEGWHQSLSGVGYWNPPQYTVPSPCDSYSLPSPPNNPTGASGYYDIDWTNPTHSFTIDLREEAQQPSKKGSDMAYFGVSISNDNLSGIASVFVGWTFGNNPNAASQELIHYNPGTTHLRSNENLTAQIEKPVGDDLYFHVWLTDVAGNTTQKVYGPFQDPIALKEFKITDIRDPVWDRVFWNDWEQKTFKSPTGKIYPVAQLPIDKDSHPIFKEYDTKKGYAFYFSMTSEYLYRDQDRIEINPKFYAIDEATNSREEIDIYYTLDDNPFIKIGTTDDKSDLKITVPPNPLTSIGSMSKLTLTKPVRTFKGRPWKQSEGGWEKQIQYTDGKLQTWYGKYYIPPTSIFVKKGVTPRPENLIENKNILINFEIIGFKNGPETNSTSFTYNYLDKKWEQEGGPKNKTKYRKGDVMVHSNRQSMLDDYEINTTW